MEVWADKNKFMKDELLKSKEIATYLSTEEIKDIFNSKNMLKNVDYIFSRSVEAED
jgi:adenylosuccinate lyase